jgi:hypothetical protein
VSLEAGLADAELVPDFDVSVPRDSNVVVGVWDLGDSHLADDVDVLVVGGGGLDLSLSVPDSGQVVESRGVDDSVVERDSARRDLGLDSEEGLLAGSLDNVPESHGLVPRSTKEDFIGLVELKVGDKVVVSGEGHLGDEDVLLLLGIGVEVPDVDFLVSSSSGDEVEVGFSVLLGFERARDNRGDHLLVSIDVEGVLDFNRAD